MAVMVFILQLVKKRPKAYSVLQYIEQVICEDLPDLIVAAEKTGMTGDKKLQFVIDRAIKSLERFVTLDVKSQASAERVFTHAVESILSTPRKK